LISTIFRKKQQELANNGGGGPFLPNNEKPLLAKVLYDFNPQNRNFSFFLFLL